MRREVARNTQGQALESNMPKTDKKFVMPRVNGKTFRCECGCNVFTEIGPLKYRCNGCRALYQGEKDKEAKS